MADKIKQGRCKASSSTLCSPAPFDEVWERLRPFLGSDYDTQQAIIVMDAFGWIDNGPCTCGLEIYGDPCPHHSEEAKEARRQVMENEQGLPPAENNQTGLDT